LNASEPPLTVVITNDDGVASQGLTTLAAAVGHWADVLIAAPLDQESRMSRATPQRSGRIFQLQGVEGAPSAVYAMDATPALAVQYAVVELCDRLPDLVLSGINYGENIGITSATSGTIGAVLEAASWGIPAIAFSMEMPGEHMIENPDYDFRLAARLSSGFAQTILRSGLGHSCYKVDFPSVLQESTPWQATFVSRVRKYDLKPSIRKNLWDKGPLFLDHNAWRRKVKDFEIGSDAHALFVERVISVSPLTADVTAHDELRDTALLLNAAYGSASESGH